MSGIVTIVGRPNVGKSTLFNRLTGQRHAIVDETAGLTRDRLYGVAEWRGRRFTLVDTAGLDPALISEDPGIAELTRGTQQQARMAIQEADLCILMVDVRAGVTGLDEDIAAILRSGGKPVILTGNKADSPTDPYYAHELYRLGLGEPRLISALTGTDTGDLLDEVVERLPPAEGEAAERVDELRVAIIGRPNVGKSSLLNYLVGEERALVSSVAGTTRDAVDTVLEHGGHQIRLVDTAGIRRRGVVTTDIEHYSLLRAMRALERSDVALVVVDTSEGVLAQDRHIAGYAADAGKGVVVIANKWDLVPQEDRIDPETLTKISAAFETVRPRASITSVLIKSPGWGGFFIGISVSLFRLPAVSHHARDTTERNTRPSMYGHTVHVKPEKTARASRDSASNSRQFATRTSSLHPPVFSATKCQVRRSQTFPSLHEILTKSVQELSALLGQPPKPLHSQFQRDARALGPLSPYL